MAPTTDRLRALDALRGLAAIIVVCHHALLTVPSIAAANSGKPTDGGFVDALVHSPLHLFWAGQEAVYLFFVLSGLVLVRAMGRAGASWDSYVPSRLLRLMGPVLPAALFTWVLYVIVPRDAEGLSIWLEGTVRTYGATGVLQDLTLLGETSGAITPLWSLRWELIFSLLLPLFVLMVRRYDYRLVVAMSLLLSFVGVVGGGDAAKYLSMFALGAALSVAVPGLGVARATLDRLPRALTWPGGLLALTGAGLLVVSLWWPGAMSTTAGMTAVAHVLSLVGIAGIIVLALVWTPFVRVLESRALQWTAAVSFSLYLVHEPIIKTAAFAFPHSRVAVVIGVAVCFGVAAVFARWIERPIHMAARRIARSGRSAATSAEPGVVVGQ